MATSIIRDTQMLFINLLHKQVAMLRKMQVRRFHLQLVRLITFETSNSCISRCVCNPRDVQQDLPRIILIGVCYVVFVRFLLAFTFVQERYPVKSRRGLLLFRLPQFGCQFEGRINRW